MPRCSILAYQLRRGPKLLYEVPAELIALMLSRPHASLSVPIRSFNLGEQSVQAASNVESALNLIGRIDPAGLVRVKNAIRRILITETPSSAYLPLTNTILLSWHHIRDYATVQVALTIVHEATHGRIAHAGVGMSVAQIARVERLCTVAEMRFLDRLKANGFTGTDPWIAYLKKRLDRPWWTERAKQQQRREMLEVHDAPPWLQRLGARLDRSDGSEAERTMKPDGETDTPAI